MDETQKQIESPSLPNTELSSLLQKEGFQAEEITKIEETIQKNPEKANSIKIDLQAIKGNSTEKEFFRNLYIKSSQALTIDGKTQSYEKWRQYFLQNPDKKDEMLGKIPDEKDETKFRNWESAIEDGQLAGKKQALNQQNSDERGIDQALNQGGERIEEKKQALNQQNSDERGIDQALNQSDKNNEIKNAELIEMNAKLETPVKETQSIP